MKKKYQIIGILILILVLLIIPIKNYYTPLKVDSLKIIKEDFYEKIEEDGYVKSKERVSIYPPFAEKIQEIYVAEGDYVNKGDKLLKIKSDSISYDLKNQRANLTSIIGEEKIYYEKELDIAIKNQENIINSSKLRFDKALRNFESNKKLYEDGAISEEDFRISLDEFNSSKIILDNNQIVLDNLKKDKTKNISKNYYQGRKNASKALISNLESKLKDSIIRAPISGVISSFDLDVGDYLINQKLMEIFSKENYNIETYLFWEDSLYIKEGMEVILFQERRDKDFEFSGIVKKIAPNATKTISSLGLEERKVKVIIEPKEEFNTILKPEYEIRCEFRINEKENSIKIPKIAVFEYEGEDSVWTIVDSKAKIQNIKLGIETSSYYEVLEGLDEDQYIILSKDIKGLEEGKTLDYK
ncbi:MAG: efflux RND transporter periplasmic adaptor subunit [Peptostreptococcaceae bacterium]|jgi:HlyD family secretion protein|nr:efflux RND transporter periplasmic adaptor subunit [Peptostreptococcaceae bacterium]